MEIIIAWSLYVLSTAANEFARDREAVNLLCDREAVNLLCDREAVNFLCDREAVNEAHCERAGMRSYRYFA